MGILLLSSDEEAEVELEAEPSGVAAVTAALAVTKALATAVAGVAVVTADLSAFTELAGSVQGSASVSATLGKLFTRTATSNLSVLAQYAEFLGILMLVDPTFQTELGTPPTLQTFVFVKKVMKGLFYVDANVVGNSVVCQVKTGDGINVSEVTNVSVRAISDVAASISVTQGTEAGGSGDACWVKTTGSGAFTIAIAGSGAVLVEMIPRQGVVMSAEVTV